MSLRYYWISFLVVLVLTVLITWVKQTRTRKEFFMIMLKVTLGLVVVGFVLVGLSKLLVALGIS